MRTYDELQSIAEAYSKNTNKCPRNPFLLASQLEIPIKPKEEFTGAFHDSPALLYTINDKSNIYFDVSSRYWAYYIFHEIAHYLLEHDTDGAKEEQEANMLACCLIAPIASLPTYLKNANDLSIFANIPIGRAEEYWEEIRAIFNDNSRNHKFYYRLFARKQLLSVIIAFILAFGALNNFLG